MSKKKTKKAEHKAKRKADADVAEQRAYKRPSTKASLKQKEPEPVSGLSEEALFRIRHAAEFDDESVVAGNNNLANRYNGLAVSRKVDAYRGSFPGD
jgi:hypothetical protein